MEFTEQNFSVADLIAARKGGSLKIAEEYQPGASWMQAQRTDTTRSVIPCFEHNISTAIKRVLARHLEAEKGRKQRSQL